MSEINKSAAADIWDALTITVDSVKSCIKVHENSTFLGFIDLTLDLPRMLPGFKMKLRGISVKILKGKAFLDMPAEKGGDGKYYPSFFPLSAELRTVLTTAIFENPEIDALVNEAAELINAGQSEASEAENTTKYNPFRQ